MKKQLTEKDYSCDCFAIHEDVIRDVEKSMISSVDMLELSQLFKIFGDGTRLKIMEALNHSEMCVCDLAVLLNMTKSAISHQLKVLRDENLVKFKKNGKQAYYSLADDHVKEILDVAYEHISEKK